MQLPVTPTASMARKTMRVRYSCPSRSCEAPVGERRLLAERDHRFDHAAQLLCLGKGGLDDLVFQQRHGHVARHREAMAAGAIELPESVAVPHLLVPSAPITRFVRSRGPRAASSPASCRVSARARPELP